MRSNGSLCVPPSELLVLRVPLRSLIPENLFAKSGSRSRRRKSSAPGNFPILTLVAPSHAEAALTRTSLLREPSVARAFLESRGLSDAHQRIACAGLNFTLTTDLGPIDLLG